VAELIRERDHRAGPVSLEEAVQVVGNRPGLAVQAAAGRERRLKRLVDLALSRTGALTSLCPESHHKIVEFPALQLLVLI
jgi:hypothetical protein